MNIREQAQKRPAERMSNLGFRLMSLTFDLIDLVRPYIDRRVTTFGIQMTKDKILASGLWIIQAETPDHLTCRPA